ncbi:unnamed protein product [Mytilus edulis]|uniref:Endonuclease/exonuclease/phosphatase domain-containing protein n=1 Tax=Mytilus edulis TaxID=6550 RepID=A0A8S3SF27_MYTED|nr:unnamed protein product [Mytilus edulis]
MIGIVETHLVNHSICIDNYKWYGNNRKLIHTRAKTGSGGVGLLVKEELLTTFNIDIEDESTDGIIWIKFVEKNNDSNKFYVSVVYLPPEFSARSTNAYEFFDTLMSQIYSIPNGCPFYICGDFNSRIGDMEDYIPGVDNLPEREVIDFKANSYGEIFCEFLSNVNCCVLNGRNHISNDYTYVSTRGSSVVDFCITPFENINSFKKFEVIRASDLANKSLTTGSIEPKYIPDHSVLCWEFETAICENTNKQSVNIHDNRSNHIVYNVKNIPDTWMNDENSINLINSCIANIESCNGIQVELDNIYNEFINVIHNEMNDKLDKKIKIMNSVNNKKRRFKKRWWTDELTVKWNQVCLAEKQYLHCTKVNSNTHLRQMYVNKRKEFDKLVQQSKRQYWHSCQEELVNLNKSDPRQFWRKIGNIGIGNDRQSKIPNEVLRSDGSVTNNIDDVLQKWKDSFHGLLNSDPDNNNNFGVENLIVKNDIVCNDLDDYISFDEVYKVAMAAKNGKSPGVDCIQAELCKNYAVILL